MVFHEITADSEKIALSEGKEVTVIFIKTLKGFADSFASAGEYPAHSSAVGFACIFGRDDYLRVHFIAVLVFVESDAEHEDSLFYIYSRKECCEYEGHKQYRKQDPYALIY